MIKLHSRKKKEDDADLTGQYLNGKIEACLLCLIFTLTFSGFRSINAYKRNPDQQHLILSAKTI